MPMEQVEGWIFDAYPERGLSHGLRVWIITPDGRHRDFLDPWQPVFHVSGSKSEIDRVLALLQSQRYPTSCAWVEHIELFSGKPLRVLEIRVPPLARDKLVVRLKDMKIALYDADIHLVQTYHYDRGHFPLARCSFILDGPKLVSWELQDDPWALDYELPPLKTMHLALSGSEVAGKVDPNHAIRGQLVLSMDGYTHELEGTTEEQLETLARRIQEWDPDVITSEWGDSVLMPQLDRLARDLSVDIPFSRDLGRGQMPCERNNILRTAPRAGMREVGRRKDRSFYTYGRVIYQNGARYLFGRWHLDLNNSFMLRETGMTGLFEIARIARIPVQRAGRCTIGTSLSSMQMAWAWRNNILIPMDKQQAEDFRPATDLLIADKGGLCYAPKVGWHENVAEYDFTSMYPEMMVRHNISPETVNCLCCPENLVPEIGHHLCKRRRGLVPSVLAPILEKRAKYKVLAKAGGPNVGVYKARATAHKWCLVCCFGYLGFKNARFGKIESHESVTAWGREVLLRAKDAAESRGFEILHALVDSLWFKITPGTDLEELRLAIEREAGCPLGLDGVYKWIRFCPSKMDGLSGVPGRYFGVFSDGSLKIRGIASRRHDTPKMLKALQAELLDRLAKADGLTACREILPELSEIVKNYESRIREGGVRAEELAITFNLSKAPKDYVHDTMQSIAAKQLAAAGIKLHPGETVRYIIAAANEKVKDWRTTPLALLDGPLEYDAAKYLELLRRAANEILDGL